jgi:hypothetical protein
VILKGNKILETHCKVGFLFEALAGKLYALSLKPTWNGFSCGRVYGAAYAG